MKKTLLLSILLLLITTFVSAQTNKEIKIKFVDAKTSLAVEGAGCAIVETGNGFLSNKEGVCLIPMNGDSVKITINHIKYKPTTVTITSSNSNTPIQLVYNEFEIERQKNVKNDNRSLLKTFENKRFIKGKVIDFETGEPMEDATVLICGTEIGAVSDAKGEFTIPHWYKNDVIGVEVTFIRRKTKVMTIHTKEKSYTIPNPIKLESIIIICE